MASLARPLKEISIFLYDLNLGGTEKVMVNLANFLSTHGFQVTILMVGKNSYLQRELLDNIQVISLNKKKIIKSFIPLIRYIRNNKINTFIANVWPLTILTIGAGIFFRGFNKKVLLVEHANLKREFSGFSSIFRFFQKISIMFLYPKSFKVIAVSEGVGNDLIDNKNVPETSMRVIHNPVAIEHNLNPPESKILSEWLNFQGAKLISVGNLKTQKNYPYLLSILAKLKSRNFHFKQLIVGEGPERKYLEDLISSLGLTEDVILAGSLDSPIQLMNKADLFILSSRLEGFGLVLVEALATGTTVVSTDCESGPAEILQDGALGYLAPLENAEKFSEIIIHANHNKLSPELLINRSKDFSINLVGPKYIELINQMK
jgi:glycosyltransferase involved in cell wall biosynthesis